MAPYLIEAVVQPSRHSPYIKVMYISTNASVEYQMEMVLQNEYYKVASVKSRPALEEDVKMFSPNTQGNMRLIDNCLLIVDDANEHVVPNSDPTTGS